MRRRCRLRRTSAASPRDQAEAIEQQEQRPLRVGAVQFATELHHLAEEGSFGADALGERRGAGDAPRLFDIEQGGQRAAGREQVAGLDLGGERLQGRGGEAVPPVVRICGAGNAGAATNSGPVSAGIVFSITASALGAGSVATVNVSLSPATGPRAAPASGGGKFASIWLT